MPCNSSLEIVTADFEAGIMLNASKQIIIFKRTTYRNIKHISTVFLNVVFLLITRIHVYLKLLESFQVHRTPFAKFSLGRAVHSIGQRLCGVLYSSLASSPPLHSEKVLSPSLNSSWRCHSFHGTTSRNSLEWWRNVPQPTSVLRHYIRDQWIQNLVYPTRLWNVYHLNKRTM